jgi:ankyrin repeat protein
MDTRPLFDAIRAGDLPSVDRFLAAQPAAAGASDASGLSALTVAAYHGQWSIVERLRATGIDLDRHEAAIVGDTDRLLTLLDEADREAEIEASTGGPDVAARQPVAPIDERSADGFSALHLASFFGRSGTVHVLLDRGADPNLWATGGLHVQPLHSAVAGGHEDVARMLIEGGAEIDRAQGEGYTPLMGAAQSGLRRTVDLLLARGADPRTYNVDILTAADLAERAGHAGIAATIRAASG